MDTSKRKLLEGRWMVLILLSLVVVFVLAFAAAMMFETPLSGIGTSDAQTLDEGWSIVDEDGVMRPLGVLPQNYESDADTIVLSHALSDEEKHAEYVLALSTRYATLEVWADDALVYASPAGKDHALSSMWHFIPMKDLMDADNLKVALTRYDDHAFELGTPYLDSAGAVHFTLLASHLNAIVFAVVCFFLTLVFLGIAFMLRRWGSKNAVQYVVLALFVFLSGLWILLDSKVTALDGGNYAFTYFMSYAAFYLLPAPYLLYIRLLAPDVRKPLNVLIVATLLNACLCMALHMAGLVQLRDTAVAVHAIIVASIPVSTWAFWQSVVRRKELALRFTFLGVLAVYVCGLVSIAFFHVHSDDTTLVYIVGFSLLFAGMSGDAISSFGRFWRQKDAAERYRRLAMEDNMTGLGNRNAFQIYMNKLPLLQPARLAIVTFDVDGLKQINDQLGHQAGDRAIFAAAQAIHSAFGKVAGCYRIGGDEFAVVAEGAVCDRVDEKLVQFEETLMAHWDTTLPSGGVSYGWAQASFDNDHPLTKEILTNLSNQADQALYRNKAARKKARGEENGV